MRKQIAAIIAAAALVFASVTSFTAYAVEVDGKTYIPADTVWDLDFNDSTIKRDGVMVSICDADGVEYRNGQNVLGAHTGSADSTIDMSVNDAADKDYGQSLHFASANSSDNVQFNNLLTIKSFEGMFIFELDVCASDFNADKSFAPTYNIVGGTATYEWAKSVVLNKSGNFSFGGGNKKADINKWYRIAIAIDSVNNMEYAYVDGQLLGIEYLNSSQNITGVYKLSVSMKGAESEMWLDNMKMYVAEPLPFIETCEYTDEYVDIAFSENIDVSYFNDGENVVNISASCGLTPIFFTSCELAPDSDNVLRFSLANPLPTGATTDIAVAYKGADIKYGINVPNADVDVYDVMVMGYDGFYNAEAWTCNSTGEDVSVIMMLVLYDENDRVVAIGSSMTMPVMDGGMVLASAYSEDAEYAEVFFLKDWTTLKAFKNVIYSTK